MSAFAKRLAGVSASPTLTVAAEAERLRRAGFDVVDFSAGEPDFPTPAHVKAAGKAAIDADFTRYTVAAGIPELREAICRRYRQDYGVDIAPTEVLVTVGGKQALFNTALALFDPGDEVITHAPCWPTIPEQVKLMGATPVIVPGSADDGFAVHADAIVSAMTSKTKAVILNSPGNPTGALIDEDTVAAIADAAAARGVWIIVDLCYEQLVYDPVPHNLPKVLFARHRNRTVLGRLGIERVRDDRVAVRVERGTERVDVGVERDCRANRRRISPRSRKRPRSRRSRAPRTPSSRCSTNIEGAATAFTAG